MKIINGFCVLATAFLALSASAVNVSPTNRWIGATSGGSWKDTANWETSNGSGGWTTDATLLASRVTSGGIVTVNALPTESAICVWDFSKLATGATVTYDYGAKTRIFIAGLIFGKNKGNITLATSGNEGASFANGKGDNCAPVYITVPEGTIVSWRLSSPLNWNYTGYGNNKLCQIQGGGTFSFDQASKFCVYDRTLTVADATVVFNQQAFTEGSHRIELKSDKAVVKLGCNVDFTVLYCNYTGATIDVDEFKFNVNGFGTSMSYKGKIKGSGTFEVEPSGIAAFTGDLSEFTGKFSVVGPWLDLTKAGSTFGELNYNLDYGCKVINTNRDFTAKSLVADGVDDEILTGKDNLITIGNAKQSQRTVYNARITGEGDVVKAGEKYALEISGNSTYSGRTEVAAGSLRTRNFYPFVSEGLLAFWTFEDYVHPFMDITTNAITLTTVATDTKLTASYLPTMNEYGARSRRSVCFAGKDGFSTAQAASSSAFAALAGDASFTHSMWVLLDPISYYSSSRAKVDLMSIGTDGSSANACAILTLNGPGTTLSFKTGRSGALTTPFKFVDGQWHHIAITYENRRRSIYIDGVLKNSDSKDMVSPMAMSAVTAINFGYCTGSDVSALYSGEMDNIAIIARCLDADEIEYLYRNNRPEPRGSWEMPVPSAHWTFDDTENPYLEVSGNSNILLEQDLSVTNRPSSKVPGKLTYYAPGKIAGAYGGCVQCQNGGCLRMRVGANWPDSMPSGNDPFTIFCRMRTSADGETFTSFWFMGVQSWMKHINMLSCDYPRKIGIQWSDNSGYNVTVDIYGAAHYMKSQSGEYSWMDTTTVYDPVAKKVYYYVDGSLQSSLAVSNDFNIDPTDANFRFMLGGRPDAIKFITTAYGPRDYKCNFVLDDVQVFNHALTEEQVKILSRNLRPSATDDVLPTVSPVTVDADARLEIDENGPVTLKSVDVSGELYIGALSMLTLTEGGRVAGTLSGSGSLNLAVDTDLSAASGDYSGIITTSARIDASSLSGPTLKLVDDVVWTIDPDDATTYPICKTSGKVILPKNGTVYFSSVPKKRQTIEIFSGTNVSAPDGTEGWVVRPVDDRYTTSFAMEDGKLKLTINPYRGSAIIFK